MNKTIKCLLIANRGEIACRIMRTAHKLGISTVAIYSDADRNAQHVKMADQAIHIGPSAAAESYLIADKVIAAAKQAGADAIHPGYGFLSENPDFAQACEVADIKFIGPSSKSMIAMALKGAAKDLMEKAGVPCVPGYHGDAQDDETLYAEALRVGFPLLIKAVAGGGGKGMRSVHTESELAEAIKGARSEGEKSFGNGKLLIEKLIEKPRHIELQVFGDSHGNVVHLLERDCSIQRRHQKVIEEAPAPGISDELRKAMGDAAIKAADAINYEGAGTIEFIVDVANGIDNAPFYFMEMNTRLQVEHPVTEMITGQDLVEWQIRVAEGAKLPLSQQEIIDGSKGHSVEVRLYAEDPANDFLPAVGTLSQFDIEDNDNIRVESGVISGDEISIYYDPMIAKIVAYGTDRDAAILTLIKSLENSHIAGLVTNRDFLIKTLAHEKFMSGDVYTNLLADYARELCSANEIDDNDYLVASLSLIELTTTAADPWAVNDAFASNLPHTYHFEFEGMDTKTDSGAVAVEITRDGNSYSCEGKTITLHHSGNLMHVTIDGHRKAHRSSKHGDIVTLSSTIKTITIPLYKPDYEHEGDATGSGAILSPMPGKILDVLVADGDDVKTGDTLLVLEAMKMEQRITATIDGTVSNLSATAGAQVTQGALLLEITNENSGD